MTAGRAVGRIAVRISADVWQEEVERFAPRSPARSVAEGELSDLEINGVCVTDLQRCAELGPDGTMLGGLVKAYAPITKAPASERPYGFVFSPGLDDETPYLAFVAFGERHPRTGVRSVYERAHKRRDGRYPDQ